MSGIHKLFPGIKTGIVTLHVAHLAATDLAEPFFHVNQLHRGYIATTYQNIQTLYTVTQKHDGF